MKELDFLPDWYKRDRRHQSNVRRQCVALGIIFLVMMTFNLTATHRANRVAADLSRMEDRRILAETITYEFNETTKALNTLKARANLIEQLDSRIEVSAVLAEVSHLIDDTVVLRKVELLAEPFPKADEKEQKRSVAPRAAGKKESSGETLPAGHTRFLMPLSGIAASPADAVNLVRRLEESSYFRRVQPSYSNAKLPIAAKSPGGAADRGTAAKPQASLDVTEFEMACYVANYKERDE